MRKIDTTTLPRKKYGNTTRIDWEKAVGYSISFVYDQVQGNFIIEKYIKGNYILISYQGKTKKIRTCHLMQFKFRELVLGSRRRLQKLDFQFIPKVNEKYDWMHSIGKTIPFLFNGISGELLITNYQTVNGYGYLTILYEQEEYKIRNINLLNGKVASIISYGKYHYEIGQTIKENQKNITILNRTKTKTETSKIIRKRYQYHCNSCGYEGWTDENSLSISKKVCSHCACKVVIKGKTDIKTEASWLAKFFQKKDKHLIYTERKNSNKKIYPICPECHLIRKTPMQICTIYKNHSIACPCCSDRVSYPEKFIMAFFKQLKVHLIYQPKKTEIPWCENYFYDFYDSKRKVIIEVNGIHHYKDVKHYNRTLEEVREIDQKKKDLAVKNNCRFIAIDCRYSELEFIKESLSQNKELQEIYSFKEEDIDYKKCELATIKSIYYKIYKYKKKHPKVKYKELEKKYGIYYDTISKALKRIEKYNSG